MVGASQDHKIGSYLCCIAYASFYFRLNIFKGFYHNMFAETRLLQGEEEEELIFFYTDSPAHIPPPPNPPFLPGEEKKKAN